MIQGSGDSCLLVVPRSFLLNSCYLGIHANIKREPIKILIFLSILKDMIVYLSIQEISFTYECFLESL